jgi:hypothetical protein
LQLQLPKPVGYQQMMYSGGGMHIDPHYLELLWADTLRGFWLDSAIIKLTAVSMPGGGYWRLFSNTVCND